MNNAKLYQKTNSVQRRDAKKIIEEFSALFDQRKNAKLLDVGCGSGDVLVEILFPYLENSFDQVVGSDISQEMVKHAWDKYRNKSKHLKFQRMDIESDFLSSKSLLQGNEEWKKETFDIITSFYCLHWIQDQRQAISNIYKLLKPNGTCLLTFLISNPIFDVYLKLSEKEKFSSYMKDVRRFISPYHFEEKPLEAFSEKLYNVNFNIVHMEIRDQIYIYESLEILRYSVKAVNPFTSRMPESLENEFLDEYLKIVESFQLLKYNKLTGMTNIMCPYKLMIAIASK